MRARNIKPGFFKNERLAEIEPLGRILFEGLWCMSDREGRLEDRPKRIKAEVLPYDDCNVDLLLDELMHQGFILRYEVNGRRYIWVISFSAHQNPHKKETGSIIPPPQETTGFTETFPTDSEVFSPGPEILETSPQNSETSPGISGTRPADSLIPDSGFLIPDFLIPDSLIADSNDSERLNEEWANQGSVLFVFDYKAENSTDSIISPKPEIKPINELTLNGETPKNRGDTGILII